MLWNALQFSRLYLLKGMIISSKLNILKTYIIIDIRSNNLRHTEM